MGVGLNYCSKNAPKTGEIYPVTRVSISTIVQAPVLEPLKDNPHITISGEHCKSAPNLRRLLNEPLPSKASATRYSEVEESNYTYRWERTSTGSAAVRVPGAQIHKQD